MPTIRTLYDNHNRNDLQGNSRSSNNLIANESSNGKNNDTDYSLLGHNFPVHNENTSIFLEQCVYHIPTLPQADHAKQLLQKIVSEFIPIIQQRKYPIISISELCCCCDGIDFVDDNHDSDHLSSTAMKNRVLKDSKKRKKHKFTKVSDNLWGYNQSTTGTIFGNRGRVVMTYHTIHLRLRETRTNHTKFYSYDDIAGTLAHELAHCEVSPHNQRFYKVMDSIVDDHAILMSQRLTKTLSNGMQQPINPFTGNGHRLGSNISRISEDRNDSFSGNGYRLGSNHRADHDNQNEYLVSLVEAVQKHRQKNRIEEGGGYILGGDDIFAQFMTPREAAYVAAEARFQKQKLRQRDRMNDECNINDKNVNSNDDLVFCQPCVVTRTNEDGDDDTDGNDEDGGFHDQNHERKKNYKILQENCNQKKQIQVIATGDEIQVIATDDETHSNVEIIILDDDNINNYNHGNVGNNDRNDSDNDDRSTSDVMDNGNYEITLNDMTAPSSAHTTADYYNSLTMIEAQKENRGHNTNLLTENYHSGASQREGVDDSDLLIRRQPLIEKALQSPLTLEPVAPCHPAPPNAEITCSVINPDMITSPKRNHNKSDVTGQHEKRQKRIAVSTESILIPTENDVIDLSHLSDDDTDHPYKNHSHPDNVGHRKHFDYDNDTSDRFGYDDNEQQDIQFAIYQSLQIQLNR